MKFFDPRLFRVSRSSRGLISVAVVSAILITFTTVAQAFLLSNLITSVFQSSQSIESLQVTIGTLVIVFVFRIVLTYTSERATNQISHRIRVDLRKALFSKILTAGSELNIRFGPARISLISTRAITNLEPYFTRFVPQLFIAFSVPVVVGLTIAWLDLASGLIAMVTVPLIPLFGALIGKYTSDAMQKRWQTLGILSGYLLDLLSGLTTLRIFGREKIQEERLQDVGDRYRVETMQVLRISFLTSLALELIATLSVALIAVSIGLRLVDGNIELWRGLTILILAPEVYWPIRNLSTQFHASADGMESAKDIFDILDFEIETLKGRTNVRRTREIRWEKLVFEYPGREDFQIPAGKAHSGEITVIAGPSGTGKTTLINSILGLITPNEGKIWVSTNNSVFSLREIEQKHWLSMISWVPQDPHFPTGRVLDFFRLSNPDVTEAEVNKALSRVNLDGINLEGPITFSVGQRRRLAIARSLMRNHEILIMDEPSASLDTESEGAIVDVLRSSAASGKIVIVVSHRSEIMKSADKIHLLESVYT